MGKIIDRMRQREGRRLLVVSTENGRSMPRYVPTCGTEARLLEIMNEAVEVAGSSKFIPKPTDRKWESPWSRLWRWMGA